MIANLAGLAAAVAMLLVAGLFLVYPLQVLAVAVFFTVTGGAVVLFLGVRDIVRETRR